MLSFLYAAVTRWRRFYPGEPRALTQPVVSIGNLAVGGRAKTPMAELVARTLLGAGERPAILSRGYARARGADEPVIVRDAENVRASLDDSGDEPLMMAERLDGVIVVVGADRARAGVVAERLGATVHVLDDGFQHLRLERDIDIVMIDPDDPSDEVIPIGRLREPIDALDYADGIVVLDGAQQDRADAADGLSGIPGVRTFTAVRRVEPPPPDLAGGLGFLASGIADNTQFAAAAHDAGWQISGAAGFKDHHRYAIEDAEGIVRKAAAAGAAYVLTTAKDAVRLREVWHADLPLHIAELSLEIDDRAAFDRWLIERITQARTAHVESARRRRQDGARRAS